ncbi:hypothetical protein [Zhongshania sp.]|uniref:hypothetical protein n=1 Tax=Zhongshania sp. TaxID=1971902 RepID=UPI001B45584C|nr:hypothetical protein [Zhongshania sp.]MBQ0796789.1 hypothetical protein [Zhongshania sp.]
MKATKLGDASPRSVSLGQLLVAGGFISASTLQDALNTQQWSRRRLGEVLVQRDILSRLEKQTLLELQKKLATHAKALRPDGSLTQTLQLSLGQLLLNSGEITAQQLESALAEHSLKNRRLGEVLVEQQSLTPIRLAQWLKLQKKLVSAAAVATWMMAGSCNVAADEREQNLWKKFISGKFHQEKTKDSHLAWGQLGAKNLGNMNIQNRDVSELRRSRDGTLTLRFGEKGLNITKRF